MFGKRGSSFLIWILTAVFLLGATAADAATELVVLPIDRAKFLLGQLFDMEVEVRGAKANEIKVTLNGKEASEFFGVEKNFKAEESLTSLRFNGVSFSKAGTIKVEVEAKIEGQTLKNAVEYTVVDNRIEKPVKNVILFIGDGMGLPSRQIARILSKGIRQGKYHGLLDMELLTDGTALVTTSGYDSLVTDSANSASAYATGHKSVVNAMGVYENSGKDHASHPRVENIAELVKRVRGMSVGIVSTSNITDATPAAMIAHTRRRAEQNYIAEQFSMADVILGGGSRHFLPQSVPGSKRKDERNLIEEFKEKGFVFAGDRDELQKAKGEKILGLFQLDNLNVYLDREIFKDPEVLGSFKNQPTLMEMTQKAIDVLSQNDQGFFLMVEGACIDKQLHAMDWQRAAYDTIEFDKAVALARKFAEKNGDTLIIATADHSHGVSITGTYHELDGKKGREAVRVYQDSIFPTFEDKDKDGFPENPEPDVTLAVQFANYPDHYETFGVMKRPISLALMSGDIAVANSKRDPQGRFIQGNLPSSQPSEVHSAEDVPLSASGRGAEYFKGVMDNTEVFFAIVRALGLIGQ